MVYKIGLLCLPLNQRFSRRALEKFRKVFLQTLYRYLLWHIAIKKVSLNCKCKQSFWVIIIGQFNVSQEVKSKSILARKKKSHIQLCMEKIECFNALDLL